jgi:glutamate 5-kinase
MFERLEEGMNTKITADNKGYKLLLKLGFKEGGALGKLKVASQTED